MTRRHRDWLGRRCAELPSAGTCRFCQRTEKVRSQSPSLHQRPAANHSPPSRHTPESPQNCGLFAFWLWLAATPKVALSLLSAPEFSEALDLTISNQRFGPLFSLRFLVRYLRTVRDVAALGGESWQRTLLLCSLPFPPFSAPEVSGTRRASHRQGLTRD